MRIAVGLVLILVFGTTAATAETSKKSGPSKAPRSGPKFSGKLLTYRQLITLSKEKRLAYVRGVAELLTMMEGMNSRYLVADNQRAQELREYVAFLKREFQMLPEALADKDTPNAKNDKSIPFFNTKTQRWECRAGLRFDYPKGLCLELNEYGEVYFEGGKCPTATSKPIPYFVPNTVACVPQENWDIVKTQETRRAALESGDFNWGSTLRSQKPERQIGLVLGKKPGFDASGNPVQTGVEDKPASDAKDKPADSCVPSVNSCKDLSDADRQTAITRFRSTETYGGVDANVCVAGGFLSSYETSRKVEGKCKIPNSVTFKDIGESKCGAGKVLCNPVLFCVGAKAPRSGKITPMFLCVEKDQSNKKNMQITRACARDYQTVIAGKDRTDSKGNPVALLPQHPEIKGSACDPKAMPDALSLSRGGKTLSYQAEWDKMIADTEKLRDIWCGNSDFAALFCDECAVITDKIYSINKDYTGSGCPEQEVPVIKAEAKPEVKPAADHSAVDDMTDAATTE